MRSAAEHAKHGLDRAEPSALAGFRRPHVVPEDLLDASPVGDIVETQRADRQMDVDRVETLPKHSLAQSALIDLADHVDDREVEIRDLGRALEMPGMVDVLDHD